MTVTHLDNKCLLFKISKLKSMNKTHLITSFTSVSPFLFKVVLRQQQDEYQENSLCFMYEGMRSGDGKTMMATA